MIGYFIKLMFPKLRWFALVGGYAKVHALPLFCGAGMGLAAFTLQTSGAVTVNLTPFLNQTLLDSVCATYGICGLLVDQGSIQLSSLLIGVGASFAFDRFYLAESPTNPWLVAAEKKAEELASVAGVDDAANS